MIDPITLSSKLDQPLRFVHMHATERLGELFRYDVDFLSEDAELDLPALLGSPMTVTLKLGNGYTRYFNGIVIEATQQGYEADGKVRHAAYSVVLAPKPWLLTQKLDCRIFAKTPVPDIIKTVLAEVGYADERIILSRSYPERDYCVQYRESYFNFISRLMEQEGIYYYFTHTADSHVMVLADALGAHSDVPGFEEIPYYPETTRGMHGDGIITRWGETRDLHSLKVQLTDYDPLNPRTSLLATRKLGGSADYPQTDGLDIFDYPGAHALVDTGEHYARVRAEALDVAHLVHRGSTDACSMGTGRLFKLTNFPGRDKPKQYLVTGTSIDLTQPGATSGGDGGDAQFACDFEAIASTQPFRNLPRATQPRIVGLQTAVVTGSETDEDIAVDEYGRVQVNFHWNMPGKPNAQCSCPVRVASQWAGKAWGAVSIPRVGQEVVVSFLEGDPDRPLIIGSVYNAVNTVPYALPDNKTQSGIKSRSLLGEAADYNELRIEDKKGSEDFFIHAQKDMHEEVENDHVVAIEHDETVEVKNDQKLTVGNDQTEKITHDRKIAVNNDDALDVRQNGTTTIGQKFKLSAGQQIDLVCGLASITLKSSGEVEIKGIDIKITGENSVAVQGQTSVDIGSSLSVKVHSDAMMSVESSGMTTVKGSMLTLNGEAMAKLGGGITMIG